VPDIIKTLGATATLKGGVARGFDPDIWLESLIRVIESYVQKNSSAIYDIRFSFPEADERAEFVKLPKTVIHFEIDDIDNPRFGMGDNVVEQVYNEAAFTVTGIEAIPHVVNMDVGVWASPNSGGVTARLRAYQLLSRLFAGSEAYEKAINEADFEIVNFTGGSFVREKVSDVPLFRVVGITLVVRVFERRVRVPSTFIETYVQNPQLQIPA
jgi:hypothetical protein